MSKTSKKLSKDSKKYKDLDYQQSTLISALHENWRQFYKYRQKKAKGEKVKAPFTMVGLQEQQNEINEIRKKIGKIPISLMQDFNKILKDSRV